MASLALLLKQKGHRVFGSDQNVYPPMSDLLAEHKIPILNGFKEEHLQQPFDVAVVGNAVSRGNPEVEYLLNRRLPFASLPEIIRQEFAQTRESIVITGTHGKTTTTALMSWILHDLQDDPTFLIGGISKNLGTSARLGQGPRFVIEGDEYDSAFFDKRPKFLHYFPRHLIINNIEFDHADIYRDLDQIQDGFKKLLRCVPKNGLIVANGESENVRQVLEDSLSPLEFFGRDSKLEWTFNNVAQNTEATQFSVFHRGQFWGNVEVPLFGEHQIMNTLAVIGVAHNLGFSPQAISNAIRKFQNVTRRLDFWGSVNGAPFFDDFAHHPTAIAKTLQAFRNRFPDKRIIAIFEPRTNTTVQNIFQKELAEALGHADEAIIGPIHRAERISAEKRLNLSLLKADLERKDTVVTLLDSYDELIPTLRSFADNSKAILLMTNGSLKGNYRKLKEFVKNKTTLSQ